MVPERPLCFRLAEDGCFVLAQLGVARLRDGRRVRLAFSHPLLVFRTTDLTPCWWT